MFSHYAKPGCFNMMLIKALRSANSNHEKLTHGLWRSVEANRKASDWWVISRAQKIEKRRTGRGKEVQERKARWEGRFTDTEIVESGRWRERRKESESVRYDSELECMVKE
ncbi:hypothetical protein E2C01_070023 [Portunus trituberculatus]|uniref:Uncharacterized protein n=1 Tax=Portunus trituberculatus TaxID=210409 RepID=A0A5B7HT50_PORTR|nr:hypothetical protein [Portunus trituberculatus]